jgi:alpha-ketoglutarate-dependent taurine dioxygenase
MSTAGFEATPLSPLLGAVVTGIDLSAPVGAADAAALRALARSHYLLLFPGQRLAPEDQVRAVSVFGAVAAIRRGGPRHTTVAAKDGDDAGFHCDYGFTRSPLPFVSLYGLEISPDAAGTAFVNGVRACAELPPVLRARIAGRRVFHAADITGVGQRSSGPLPHEVAHAPPTPGSFRGTYHPAILAHPDIGAEVLFLTRYLSVAIEGLPADESEALLAALFEHLYAPERVYVHRWSPGDLLVFDNIALQHSRTRGGTRTLRRVVTSTLPLEDLLAS